MTEQPVVRGIVKTGVYYDSVSLMKAAQKLREMPGVIDSATIMGSPANKAILESAGLMSEELRAAGESDLLIVFKASTAENAERITGEIDHLLTALKTGGSVSPGVVPRTIDDARGILPGANLALISVAGKYAGREAMRALQAGMHVMLFSDNVALETELALKTYAAGKGLLVMGPDCGTAIINGIPLGFANAVNQGDIGIVAASGTGLQEVCCIISNEGAGISQAIGTGSRDINAAVGGIMFIQAIEALANDPATRVLLLVSKPPDRDVFEKIASSVKNIGKPVAAVFLGATRERTDKYGMIAAISLEEGALAAAAFSQNKSSAQVSRMLDERDGQLRDIAATEIGKLAKSQRYLRGLFSGGTFCYEAQVLLKDDLSDVHSNSPISGNRQLNDPLKSKGHTLVDMGADEFTVGRLHPMIDYSLRNRRILEEAGDPETAVILVDIVLGYGANENPLGEITPVIDEARRIASGAGRYLPMIGSVTGTDKDPQNRTLVVEGLRQAGVIIAPSSSAACKLAGFIAKGACSRT